MKKLVRWAIAMIAMIAIALGAFNLALFLGATQEQAAVAVAFFYLAAVTFAAFVALALGIAAERRKTG